LGVDAMNRVALLRVLIVTGWSIGIAGNVVDFLQPSLLGSSQASMTRESSGSMSLSDVLLSLLGFTEFVALIGIWFLRGWGRVLFSFALTLEILVTCFTSPSLRSGFGIGLTMLSFVGFGGILALIWCSSLNERFNTDRAQPGAAPNGGPAAPVDNSKVSGGPPSVN
jgi:hypothetical protein